MCSSVWLLMRFLCLLVLVCAASGSSDLANASEGQDQNAGDATTTTTAAVGNAESENSSVVTSNDETTTSSAAPGISGDNHEEQSTSVSSTSSTSSSITSTTTVTSTPNSGGIGSSTSQPDSATTENASISKTSDTVGDSGRSTANELGFIGSVSNAKVNGEATNLTTEKETTHSETSSTSSGGHSKPDQTSSGKARQNEHRETTDSNSNAQKPLAVSQPEKVQDEETILQHISPETKKATRHKSSASVSETPDKDDHKPNSIGADLNKEKETDTPNVPEVPVTKNIAPDDKATKVSSTDIANTDSPKVSSNVQPSTLPMVSNALPLHQSVDKTDFSLCSSSLFALAALATLAVAAAAPAH